MEDDKIILHINHPEARLPQRATEQSVGYDLVSVESKRIDPGLVEPFATGLVLRFLDPGLFIQIKSRSGLAFRQGLTVLAGTIDPDYRGELIVLLHNTSRDTPVDVSLGQRIAQMIFLPSIHPVSKSLTVVESVRKDGKFGSTGK